MCCVDVVRIYDTDHVRDDSAARLRREASFLHVLRSLGLDFPSNYLEYPLIDRVLASVSHACLFLSSQSVSHSLCLSCMLPIRLTLQCR
jgi:hypothetical protein